MNKLNERTKGIIKRAVIATIVAIAIIITSVIAIPKISKKPEKGNNDSVALTLSLEETMSEAEKEEIRELFDSPSDIEGMTKGEKFAAGMNYKDGSDTDGDGLTDKEEVETYQTDPLKISTMDDSYTDGYKAEHGMDLHTVYTNENMEFPKNQSDTLKCNTMSAQNQNASILDCPYEFCVGEGEDNLAYKAYAIMGGDYSGSLSIDVSDILENNDVDIKDLAVYMGGPLFVQEGDFVRIEDVEADGTTLTFNTDDTLPALSKQVILVAKEPKTKKNILNFWKKADNDIKITNKTKMDEYYEVNPQLKDQSDADKEKAKEMADGITYAATLPLMISKEKPRIYYVETGNEEVDRETRRRMIETANFVFEQSYIKFELTEDDCKGVTAPSLMIMRKALEMTPFFHHYTRDWNDLDPLQGLPRKSLVLNYSDYKDFNFIDTAGAESDPWNILSQIRPNGTGHSNSSHVDPLYSSLNAKRMNLSTGFRHFRFPNFGTIYSPGGNCSAISYLIAYANDYGTLPNTSGVVFDTREPDETYDVRNMDTGEMTTQSNTWTIVSGAEDNDDLLNGDLSHYKTPDFVNDHLCKTTDGNSIVARNISPYENEFIKMLGGYMNSPVAESSLRKDYFMVGESIDESLLNAIEEYIDAGKTLCLGVSFTEIKDERSYKTISTNGEMGETDEERRQNWRKQILSFYLNKDEYTYNDINDAEIQFAGHTINIVGYGQSPCWDEETILYIYDCNTPNEIQQLSVYRNEDGTIDFGYGPIYGNYVYGTSSWDTDFLFQVTDSDNNRLEDLPEVNVTRNGKRYDAYDLFRLGDMTIKEAMLATGNTGDVSSFRISYQYDIFNKYSEGELSLSEAAEGIRATEEEFLDYYARYQDGAYCPYDEWDDDVSGYPGELDYVQDDTVI